MFLLKDILLFGKGSFNFYFISIIIDVKILSFIYKLNQFVLICNALFAYTILIIRLHL
jgi:hypothetical protein